VTASTLGRAAGRKSIAGSRIAQTRRRGDLSFHPMSADNERARASVDSGTVWESIGGYSRAVRIGDRILVYGTTDTDSNRLVGGDDPAAQTDFIIDKIQGAIVQLGGRLQDVVQTRIYVKHISHWESVARVHGRRFAAIRPANTLVQADLVGEGYLVEMEAEAVIGAGDAL
jgi:enamine deaminase RidA (YjgF/YER057c/UK114 family)